MGRGFLLPPSPLSVASPVSSHLSRAAASTGSALPRAMAMDAPPHSRKGPSARGVPTPPVHRPRHRCRRRRRRRRPRRRHRRRHRRATRQRRPPAPRSTRRRRSSPPPAPPPPSSPSPSPPPPSPPPRTPPPAAPPRRRAPLVRRSWCTLASTTRAGSRRGSSRRCAAIGGHELRSRAARGGGRHYRALCLAAVRSDGGDGGAVGGGCRVALPSCCSSRRATPRVVARCRAVSR